MLTNKLSKSSMGVLRGTGGVGGWQWGKRSLGFSNFQGFGSFFWRVVAPFLENQSPLFREHFIHRKAIVPYVQLSTNCGLDNSFTAQILLSFYRKPILQLVDNCTYGTIAFLCIKSSLPHCKKLFGPPRRY